MSEGFWRRRRGTQSRDREGMEEGMAGTTLSSLSKDVDGKVVDVLLTL